jgi:hypothetical protein
LYFVLPAVDGKIEQCVCTQYCVKLGKATEAFFETDSSFSLAFPFQGRVSDEDDKCSGRPSTSKIMEIVEQI